MCSTLSTRDLVWLLTQYTSFHTQQITWHLKKHGCHRGLHNEGMTVLHLMLPQALVPQTYPSLAPRDVTQTPSTASLQITTFYPRNLLKWALGLLHHRHKVTIFSWWSNLEQKPSYQACLLIHSGWLYLGSNGPQSESFQFATNWKTIILNLVMYLVDSWAT